MVKKNADTPDLRLAPTCHLRPPPSSMPSLPLSLPLSLPPVPISLSQGERARRRDECEALWLKALCCSPPSFVATCSTNLLHGSRLRFRSPTCWVPRRITRGDSVRSQTIRAKRYIESMRKAATDPSQCMPSQSACSLYFSCFMLLYIIFRFFLDAFSLVA